MAQQSKITSRPLTKALGTASILGLAIAGANFANAIQTDFGVTYQADAFYIDGDAYGNDGSGNGLANLLRLKADFKDENTGVSLHTSIQLAGDTWSGDSREDAGLGYNSDGNENVTLDLGYVQIPIGGNLLRVGRQASNWNNCFLSCDDRRDRVTFLAPTSIGTFIALYDRRNDDIGGNTVFDSADSGDAFSGIWVTKLGEMNLGILYYHYFKNTEGPGFGFQNTHIFSPYLTGALTDNVNFATGFNWMGGNDNSDGNSFFGDGTNAFGLESDDGWSGYVRLDGDVGAMNWGLQYVGVIDGGIIANGYDTYSSILNNSPDSTQNPTSLVSMGRALGTQDYDEHLVIGKLGFNVTPKLTVTGAVGWFSADNGQQDLDDTSMIYDLSAAYQINDAVTTVASLGYMTENEGMLSFGNGNNVSGVGTPADFANEDLMAANVGIRVQF
ncbi:hypothetical protein MLC59_14195 [Marinobacter bryozoorum]|uniref:hypothetical protein n=1 Tax=Marinobacter bryozoorum TaxID=256324 RepID=UPI0020045773|nr:hypothetical protein [Marinobacter bryozoorum]MCK7545315.1 hypothetical protein [Marinobacter bryozoorum]